MELRQLAHFVAVAEEGSFTRAAEREHIVQSGISTSVAALERELGVELFRRLPRGVELTGPGSALLVEARRALSAVAAAAAAARSSAGSLTGSLNVAAVAGATLGFPLARLIRDFRLTHPGVAIRVHEKSARAYQDLRAGRVDIFIAPGPRPPGVASIPLSAWPIVLACAESHPLARLASVDIACLADEPIIDVPASATTRELVDRAFAAAGIERRSVLEARGPLLLMSLIQDGVGVSFVPAILGSHARGIRYVEVRPEIGMWELGASFLGETPRNPAAQAFLDLLESAGDRGSGLVDHGSA
jgi:DNA-binding transcriptional LysR family regulator